MLFFACLIKFSWFVTFWTNKKVYFEKSSKNSQIDAQGLYCKFFLSFELIFGFQDRNYPWKRNFCVSDNFEIFVNFWNSGNFWDFKWQFWLNGHNYFQFFFRDFWSRWRLLYSDRVWKWSDKSSQKCQKRPKWRSRVKLHNLCQFWVQIRNLR